jgi:hypothetical protein
MLCENWNQYFSQENENHSPIHMYFGDWSNCGINGWPCPNHEGSNISFIFVYIYNSHNLGDIQIIYHQNSLKKNKRLHAKQNFKLNLMSF